ncbi:MAG TPA: FHA domain-containing protein [Stellaceae bacterium]|nr:FHA domain-containing protein [Stellaceae bacterium]
MEPVIWVEVLTRQRDVISRHRFAASELRVGRAYDNEIVLDDPHVAPVHLRIARDDGGSLVAEDLGSLNGLYIDGGHMRTPRVLLDGEGTIRIGQTWLRVRDAAHPVPPERLIVQERRLWPWALPLVVAIFGIEILGVWLNEIGEPRLTNFLQPLATILIQLVLWVGAWTILCRIFAGAARFERHLVLALTAMLIYSLYDEVTSYLAFELSEEWLVGSRYVVYWVMVGVTGFLNLRIVGPGRLRLKAGAAAALTAAAIAYVAINQSSMQEFVDQPDSLIHRFYPPAMRLGPTARTDAFLSRLDGLRGQLDGARDEK